MNVIVDTQWIQRLEYSHFKTRLVSQIRYSSLRYGHSAGRDNKMTFHTVFSLSTLSPVLLFFMDKTFITKNI